MKRRELLRHLAAYGCNCARDSGPHSVWRNPTTGQIQAVPRHVEIDAFLARRICQRLSVPLPNTK
ncbi:MAG: type II toxin-antitoxin system HicA family toxin [Verrucomicrobiia bacterium]